MKNVVFLAPIDYMTGKLPFDAPSSGATKGMCARHNSKNQEGIVYNSLSKIGKRTAVVTEAEQARWTKFGAISKLVGARRKDVTKRIQDQIAFKAQSTFKTLTSYLWNICTAEYNAAHDED